MTSPSPLPLTVLSAADVRAHLDPTTLIDALAQGFVDLESGAVQAPPRPQITTPDGFVLAMPAWRPGGPVAVKVVSVFEGNLERGLPNHLAVITLLDPVTGAPVCVLDGTVVTAMRTAGAAMVSVRALARPDSRRAVVVGAGVQGAEHLAQVGLVLPELAEVAVFSRSHGEAEALAATHPLATAPRDLEAAVRAADVVCLCTHSYEPVLDVGWVQPGTHVTSVGYAPPQGELPVGLALGASRLVVETLTAFEPAPVGCPELAGLDPAAGVTLGQVLSGARPGRAGAADITVYKAMGLGLEDLVAAELAWRSATAAGAGAQASL
jgi:ornithine cyclodeaminase/thiomorpholine-carboxylate dehydrogenase